MEAKVAKLFFREVWYRAELGRTKPQGRDEIEIVDIDTNAPSRAFGE